MLRQRRGLYAGANGNHVQQHQRSHTATAPTTDVRGQMAATKMAKMANESYHRLRRDAKSARAMEWRTLPLIHQTMSSFLDDD